MSVSLCHGSDWRQNRTISVPRCARCKSSAWRLHVIGWQRLAAGERRKAWLLGVPNAVVIPFASWIWVALVMKLVEGMAAEPIRVGDLLVQVAAVSLLTSLNYDWLRAVTENTLPAISAHLKKSLVESYPEIAAACSEEDWVIESVTV